MSFYPLIPLWLILLLAALSAGAAVYAYRHRNPAVEPWQHKLLLALRMSSVAVVVLMLLCPGRIIEDRNLEKSHLVFLLDRSASMATRDLRDGQSRLAQAAAFLAEHRFKRLADYPRALFSFNSQTQRHADAGELGALTADGGTDMKQAFDRIDKDIGLSRTAAVVLLSDGIDHSGFKGSEIAVPILSVQAGTDLAKSKDLGIEPFTCPDKVSEGVELTLDIPLLLQGYAQQKEARFSVFADGVPLHTATLTLTSGRLHTETVKATLTQTGIHVIRIECQSFPDEVSDLNNRRELAVEVVKSKDEIAAYFPLLNNSFRPLLREFLKDDAGVFTAVYRVSGDTYRALGRKPNAALSGGLPKSADALKEITCLILGAHNGDLLSPADALVLEQYVSRGGSLVCLAGTDSFGKIPSDSPLLRLLPVVTLEDSFRADAYRVVPDPSSDPAFAEQVNQIIADNRNAPELTLGGLNQVKDVKANAKVVLWAEGDARLPLLVWQPYGRGKVVAVLSNGFHLWGSSDRRDENFARFWRQLVAFAKNLDEDADLLKVSLPKTELAAGERVTVTAIARHPADTNGTLTVKADVFPTDRDTPVETLALDKKADCYLGELAGLKPGRYVLRVTSQDGQEVLRTRHKLLLVGDVLAENTSVRSDRDAFRAFSGEKHILTLDEADRLEGLLRETVRKNVIQREKFLVFENPAFFLAAVLLLVAEWFLRRRFNLF
jgi:hypothetical protein